MYNIPLDILERAAGGDAAAFEEIYKAASSFVYNVALGITRNSSDAEEVTQDVFMKIHRNLKKFSFRSTFNTWAYRITVNSAINRYHHSSKDKKTKAQYDEAKKEVSCEPAIEKMADCEANETALNRLLDILNPEQRACIVLRELQDLSYKDIANALAIPINTVRTRLKRAREALLAKAREEGTYAV